jgi:hypothetical protein
MSFEIREIQENDFKELPKLFNYRKTDEKLSWLYSSQDNECKNAYVAVEDNQLIGAIGYIRQPYWVDGEKFNGLIPFSWEVQKDKRGLVGIKLLYKALSGSDFYMGLDGSEDMKAIFRQMGFKKVGEARGAHKVLQPYRYMQTVGRIGVKDLARMVRNMGILIFEKRADDSTLSFKPLDMSTYDVASMRKGTFSNSICKKHLEWLSNMPGAVVHLFQFEDNGVVYKPVVVMVKEVERGIKRAAILHIPPMEKHQVKLLQKVVVAIESFLNSHNVSAITILSSDKNLDDVLTNRGFVFEKKRRPVVVKGPCELIERIENMEVYISLIESDKSVRNI